MNKFEREIRLADIIFRKMISPGEITPEEEVELSGWLEESEEHRDYYQQVARGGVQPDYDVETRAFSEERHWKGLDRRIRGRRVTGWKTWTTMAASVMLLIAFGWWVRLHPGKPSPELAAVQMSRVEPGKLQAQLILNSGEQINLEERDTLLKMNDSDIRVADGRVEYNSLAEASGTGMNNNTIRVPRGGIYSLKLSDGTTVFLNSDSELSFPVTFRGTTREVTLKGEGYFEVKPDSTRPFIVHAGSMQTRVLGTTFNVLAYPDEEVYKTTLLTGKVKVSVAGVARARVLTPGMQASWQEGTGQIELKKVDVTAQSLWRDGIILLNEEDLNVVMRALCRWYNVKYEFFGELKETYTFTGRIDRNESLDTVLRTLTLMGGPRFEIKGSTIYIL